MTPSAATRAADSVDRPAWRSAPNVAGLDQAGRRGGDVRVLDAGQRRGVQDDTLMRVDRHGSIVP
jgi:hypothetical protein